jgi:ubiquinone/menaquinone biosynthesis C-methylase UbiE
MNHERAAFFDSQVEAPWADTPYGQAENSKLERLFAQCGSLAGCAVLETGCGTGRLTELLSRQVGPIGFVHACDISRRMVQKAQERLMGYLLKAS